LKCKKCGAEVSNPIAAWWVCPGCKSDLLLQGGVYVDGKCRSTMEEDGLCDQCNAGTMTAIDVRGHLDHFPERGDWIKRASDQIKCAKCGHVHVRRLYSTERLNEYSSVEVPDPAAN
jgi:hypothetical protein